MIALIGEEKSYIAKRVGKYLCISWAILFSLFVVGCSTPAQQLDNRAFRLGLIREVLPGTEFRHVTYRSQRRMGDSLHVYLEGDGTPWLNRTWVAADPTPRDPLLMSLMVQDDASSLYLGRPCYHGQSQVPPCNPLLWTSHRYGTRVIASMESALKTFLQRIPKRELVFIGHSGGGTLAMLLAERFPQTRAVVTLAGNLDPDRWTAWHDYSPLAGSLNPASRPSLSSTIVQLHYIGGRDNNIPARLIQDAISRQRCAEVIVLPKFDHLCCWQAVWPSLLAELQSALNDSGKVCNFPGDKDEKV